MNEQGKLGFVYDVDHFAPNGELVESQHFHNLMPNEGVQWALGRVFTPLETVPTRITTRNENKYANFNLLYLSFFTNTFTPSKVFDSMYSFPVMAGEITSSTMEGSSNEREEINENYWGTVKIDIATNTINFSKITTGKFIIPTLLTGLFVVGVNNSDDGRKRHDANGFLVSEAFFPSPIQMEVNGTITVQCGCTLISA